MKTDIFKSEILDILRRQKNLFKGFYVKFNTEPPKKRYCVPLIDKLDIKKSNK